MCCKYTSLVFALAASWWSLPALAQENASPAEQAARPRGSGSRANPEMQPMAQAQAFLADLTAEQRDKALLPFDTDKRVDWHFIPMATRKGLPLMEMQPEQREGARKLLRACVSQDGFDKALSIMELEKVLKQLEGSGGRMERNPDKYYFTIFGTPAARSTWGISIEGHHLSLNFVLEGNRIVDSTPQFFATNPAILKSDIGQFRQGLQLLESEQQLALQLVNSFNDAQWSAALLPGDTPSEIWSAGQPQPPTSQPRGLAASALDQQQQQLLRSLLQAYTSKMKRRVAQERWQQIEEAGLGQVHFAWSGGKQPGQGHYYVIQGPTFFVEYINVQPDAAGNPANHIHCVWREMSGDFGLPLH